MAIRARRKTSRQAKKTRAKPKRTGKAAGANRKSGRGRGAKPGRAKRTGTIAKRKSARRVKPGPKPKPDPKFAKAGHTGAIPDPVEKWVAGLGKSVPLNEPFIIDSAGVKKSLDKLGKCCGQTLYVAYHYDEATLKGCAGLDFQPFVRRAERAAEKTADKLVATCEGEGCQAESEVAHGSWGCRPVQDSRAPSSSASPRIRRLAPSPGAIVNEVADSRISIPIRAIGRRADAARIVRAMLCLCSACICTRARLCITMAGSASGSLSR